MKDSPGYKVQKPSRLHCLSSLHVPQYWDCAVKSNHDNVTASCMYHVKAWYRTCRIEVPLVQ
jgi:hypothetical protein